jgi:hypothetical protein
MKIPKDRSCSKITIAGVVNASNASGSASITSMIDLPRQHEGIAADAGQWLASTDTVRAKL